MGLVARHVEAAGIPTLCMTSALDITRSVNPPRAAFLDFPLGHTTGAPNDPELQRKILADALSSFTSMTAPGSVKRLPYRWSGDEGWKAKAFGGIVRPFDQQIGLEFDLPDLAPLGPGLVLDERYEDGRRIMVWAE